MTLKNNIYFVTGIDTNIGKSFATGILAKKWNEQGIQTITQKLVQTGNEFVSEDIQLHRKLMGITFTKEDNEKLTMPEIFTYPASPHLAMEIDRREINFDKIRNATQLLSKKYNVVLIEGAGGLMVPLKKDYLIIDYIQEMNYPVILVTSGKLGSINHTLLSLEAIKNRNIKLHSLVYNLYPKVEDIIIQQDSENYFKAYIERYFPSTEFIKLEVQTE